MDTDIPSRRSLWRDLSDGTAGNAVRIVISLILAVFLLGVGLVATYFIAAWVPAWDRSQYFNGGGGRFASRGVRPTEGLMAVVMLLMTALWVAIVIWLFVGQVRSRSMLRPMLLTIGIIASAIVIGVVADSSLHGDQEIVIAGIVLLAMAAALMVWLLAFRAARLGRPMRNEQDKQIDIRCPDCGYRMVGLMETRCPECGKAYTLDELLGKQGFERPRGSGMPPAPRLEMQPMTSVVGEGS